MPLAALQQALAEAGEGRLVDDLLAAALADMRASRHPFEAELEGCLLLASLVEELTADVEGDDDGPSTDDVVERPIQQQVNALVALLLSAAEQEGSPDDAGLLRVLSTLLGGRGADTAKAAAERLVAAGVSLPRWAAPAGRPAVERVWCYRDTLGVQESIVVEFAYGHRQHAMSVLIDHELGGGVKDVWFTEGRDVARLRSDYASASATEPITEVLDLGPAEAAARLQRALEHPPCPEQPDQAEDVVRFLPLLRSRAAWLTEATAEVTPAP
ncbi:hypothetical protein SAMN06264364_11516 [Quadrisphaera granulorum]|uniref:Uncharacterized protein n=1 Tax=Quadrisphaera granulorum TaxID=317664 RepID=A0A316A658_9ACTN|nr:hypothetical protein [Quadrisphaera granulorum]PWJ52999.1 hypothetical protein BXY45_11516 [Quadrisphaera granulorum]SZE97164.1 hypothetical protein SAMN06264364_11516 [Quadrisphaera granulorum]